MKKHPAFGGLPGILCTCNMYGPNDFESVRLFLLLVRIKNMFMFDEGRAEKQFHYRTVMINWLYTPNMTYQELATKSMELWSKYLDYESVQGFGSCKHSCRGPICGQNGFDHCPEEALADPEAPDSDSAGRRVQESKATEPFPQQRRRISIGGGVGRLDVVDSVVGSCGTELNACFDDTFCGLLFMVGSVTPVSHPLQELLKCIEDFDHTTTIVYSSTIVYSM
jgi:hypothetical protein